MHVTVLQLANLWPLDSHLNWNLEMLVFGGGRKTEEPGEKPWEQGREPTTNSTHTWHQVQESNPGQAGGDPHTGPSP